MEPGIVLADAIRARGLYHIYRGADAETVALRGANLALQANEWVSIVGPSGSGKSTLLHVLTGLIEPSGGEVIVDGQDITRLDETARAHLRRETIGVVLQRDNLYPSLTVAENVALPLDLAGVGRRESAERVRSLLHRVGLADRSSHRAHQLSGGEMQRTAIALALAPRPKVLIADEPTGELDASTTESILDLLREETRRENTAMLMVTHNPRVAAAADRQLVMSDGVLRDAT
jgi:ABC-type lipoprotein export system ATPase subunit